MQRKVIKFKGINRSINEFQTSGECEELINLRPAVSGLDVVKPKKVKFSNIEYDVYNHSFGDMSLFIGVLPENVFEINLISDNGSITSIDSFNGKGPEYEIAFVGNMIVFIHDKDMRVYAYKNGKYVKTTAAVPDNIDVTYEVGIGYGYSEETSIESSNPSSNEFKEEVQKHWSAALGQNSRAEETFGPVIVAFNFSLSDGTEFWTNKWIYFNPFLYLPIDDDGKHMIYYEDGDVKRFTFRPYKPVFKIAQIAKPESGMDNMVKSVNVYATRPIFPYDIDSMYAKNDNVHSREIYASVTGMNESGITKQILYFQKSIPVSQLESGDVTFTLDFGNGQAGERMLEVDNGPVKRVGKMVSYNNRIHTFDSLATLCSQSVVCMSNSNDAFYEREAYVYLDCNNEQVVLKTTALVPVGTTNEVKTVYCCYPDARAKKILIGYPSSSSFSTIDLQPSSRYNYAWGEAKYPNNLVSPSSIKTTNSHIAEPNAINVSSQYNPFAYPVGYSYSVDGRIIDLVTSYLPISATQIGQYPLTIFTTAGVYALEQGDGGTLYGNITPLQPLVSNGDMVTTPQGTFFISSKNVYLLSGRDSVNITQVLDGERDLRLRDNISYQKLCCSGSGHFADYSSVLSSIDFKEFIDNAALAYDQLNNELYISSTLTDINYSYVYNLTTNTFHKVAKKYISSQHGSRYAIEVVGGSRNLVDMHSEDDGQQMILLQSRPMSLEVLYTHIQRLVLLADAGLSGTQHLCVTVFASDNLYDWKCIISAQKQRTAFRQIRTNRAAKSYKDYVILISGYVSTDTDISDLIADYTVVNRRLG